MFLSHFSKIHKITENLTSEQVEHAQKFVIYVIRTNAQQRHKLKI